MRVGVLLIGNIRTFDQCVDSLRSFLGDLNADVFVGTYDLRYGYHPCVRQSTGFYSDEILSLSKISEILYPISPVEVIVDSHSEYIRRMQPLVGRGFMPDEHASLMQFFKMSDLLNVVEKRERSLGFRYDLLLKTRCDLTYLSEVQIDGVRDGEIVVDSGNVFPNDCVLLGKRDSISTLIQTMDQICRTVQERGGDSTVDIPHGILSSASEEAGLRIVDVPLMRGVVRYNREVSYPPLPSRLRRTK
jgi:hypothetical protein